MRTVRDKWKLIVLTHIFEVNDLRVNQRRVAPIECTFTFRRTWLWSAPYSSVQGYVDLNACLEQIIEIKIYGKQFHIGEQRSLIPLVDTTQRRAWITVDPNNGHFESTFFQYKSCKTRGLEVDLIVHARYGFSLSVFKQTECLPNCGNQLNGI